MDITVEDLKSILDGGKADCSRNKGSGLKLLRTPLKKLDRRETCSVTADDVFLKFMDTITGPGGISRGTLSIVSNVDMLKDFVVAYIRDEVDITPIISLCRELFMVDVLEEFLSILHVSRKQVTKIIGEPDLSKIYFTSQVFANIDADTHREYTVLVTTPDSNSEGTISEDQNKGEGWKFRVIPNLLRMEEELKLNSSYLASNIERIMTAITNSGYVDTTDVVPTGEYSYDKYKTERWIDGFTRYSIPALIFLHHSESPYLISTNIIDMESYNDNISYKLNEKTLDMIIKTMNLSEELYTISEDVELFTGIVENFLDGLNMDSKTYADVLQAQQILNERLYGLLFESIGREKPVEFIENNISTDSNILLVDSNMLKKLILTRVLKTVLGNGVQQKLFEKNSYDSATDDTHTDTVNMIIDNHIENYGLTRIEELYSNYSDYLEFV